MLRRAVTAQLVLLRLEPLGPYIADDARDVLQGLGVPVPLQDGRAASSRSRSLASPPYPAVKGVKP